MIKSIDEYKRIYFPKQYEREKIAKMTPKEFGRYLAKKTVQHINKEL